MAIQLSCPVPFWEMASGMSARPQAATMATAARTAGRRRCCASSQPASGTTVTAAK